MRDRKEGRLAASLVALLLVGAALVLAACGGSGGTTAATTAPAAATTSTSGHAAKGSHGASTTGKHASTTAGKPSRALRAAMTAQWRHGNRAGRHACAGTANKDALAHFLAAAEAAEKRHHVAVRAGMIARIKQLPKTARHGKAAPAMAAALVAAGMPVKQRAGGFAGCMAALRRSS
jgi:hypothetical protein